MKADIYTKTVLTVIAFALATLAVAQYVNPLTSVRAQGNTFTGLQFADSGGATFFDPRTGELWEYSGAMFVAKYRLTKLGQPMVKEK